MWDPALETFSETMVRIFNPLAREIMARLADPSARAPADGWSPRFAAAAVRRGGWLPRMGKPGFYRLSGDSIEIWEPR